MIFPIRFNLEIRVFRHPELNDLTVKRPNFAMLLVGRFFGMGPGNADLA